PGDLLDYVVTIRNSGNAVASDIFFTAGAAGGTLTGLGSDGTGFTCAVAGSFASFGCEHGRLDAGASVSFAVTLAAGSQARLRKTRLERSPANPHRGARGGKQPRPLRGTGSAVAQLPQPGGGGAGAPPPRADRFGIRNSVGQRTQCVIGSTS